MIIGHPYPRILPSGAPFYVFCAKCGAEKSSTDVSTIDERPWKYYCQLCIIGEMIDAERIGEQVTYLSDSEIELLQN